MIETAAAVPSDTPAPVRSVSVVICTYNRAELLRQTLCALRECALPADCDVDILVVDNNSTDQTSAIVREMAALPGLPIRYAFEPMQGKGFALNRALAMATSDVIALTDDDVLPAHDWLIRIVEGFRRNPVVFVFGKVLPRWGVLPPPELLPKRARDIWGPLALVDYGDQPTRYTTSRFPKLPMPIGANLAVRRDALMGVGGWRTDLGRVDNSLICGEDHELCVRLFRVGLYEGLYDPALTVQHYVPAGRLTRRYFRRWYFWHGRTLARMGDSFLVELDLGRVPRVARVPRFIYRELFKQILRWARSLKGNALDALIQDLRTIQYVGFFVECWRPYRRSPQAPAEHRRRTSDGRDRSRLMKRPFTEKISHRAIERTDA